MKPTGAIRQQHLFLSYSRPDAVAAEALARSLGDAGLHVWLDTWNLVPGQPWQEILEDAIRHASTVAVCIGSAGLGSWQQEEFRAALRTRTSEHPQPLIPILLPGAETGALPSALEGLTWVDFRNGINDSREMARLVAAIESAPAGGEIEQEQRVGDDLRASGDSASALEHYERAMRIARAAYGDHHPRVSDLTLRLANVRQDLGDYSTAMTLLQQSLATSSTVYGEESEQVATVLNNLGSVLRDRGDLDTARMYFERALAIDVQALGPDHPTVANRLSNLGSVLRDRGDLDTARMYFERALAIDVQALGPDHPTIASRLSNLGSVLMDQGLLAEAIPLFQQALKLDSQLLGSGHPNVAVTLNNLAGSLLAHGEREEALRAYREAYESLRASVGAEHRLSEAVRRNLERASEPGEWTTGHEQPGTSR